MMKLALATVAALALAQSAQAVGGKDGTKFGKYFDRFITITMENEEADAVLNNPLFAGFAQQGRYLSNYHGVTHPSEPNYYAMIAGDFFGQTNDADNNISATTLVDLLEAKGVTWKSYNQKYVPGPDGACNLEHTNSPTDNCNYARKHNPFISFMNIQTNLARCQNIVGASETFGGPDDTLLADIRSGNLPQYSYFVPNQCSDGHNKKLATEDSITTSGKYLAENWFGPNGYFAELDKLKGTTAVLIQYDEGEPSSTSVITTENYNGTGKRGNLVYSLLLTFGKPVGPSRSSIKPGETCNALYSHYGMLELVESNWDLGNLGRFDDGRSPEIYGDEICTDTLSACGC